VKNGHYFDQLSSSASRSSFRGCYQSSFNKKYVVLHQKTGRIWILVLSKLGSFRFIRIIAENDHELRDILPPLFLCVRQSVCRMYPRAFHLVDLCDFYIGDFRENLSSNSKFC